MMQNPEKDEFDDDTSDHLLVPLLDSRVTVTGDLIINLRSWLRSIHFSRWQSFSGICMYVSVAGTTYAFGVYSGLLKSNLGFSQSGIEIIASVGNTGLYLSLVGGILLDRFGLHFVVYLGGFLIFIGFFYIWLAVEGYMPADIISISVFFFLSQFGVCCHISSAVTSAVKLFPSEARGSVVGLAKGYFGMSSAVLSDFSGGYFSNAKAYFILFIAIAIPCIGVAGSSLANFIPEHLISFEADEKKGISTSLLPFFLHWLCLWTILLAVGYTQYAYEYTGDRTTY
jgi:MFS family permease